MTFTLAESVLLTSEVSDRASRPDPDLAAVIVEVGIRAVAVNRPGPDAATEAVGVATKAASTTADSAIEVLQLLAIPVMATLLIRRPRPARGRFRGIYR